MKKISLLMLFCLLCFVTACQPPSAQPASTEPVPVVQPVDEKTFSTEDVQQKFLEEPGKENLTVTGCVTTPDGAYGLIGIVRYTDENGNPSWLSFVGDGWSYPVGLDADGALQVWNNTPLVYKGNGVVSCVFLNPQTEIIYDYTVSYSYTEDENGVGHTHFKVESTERKHEK